MPELLTVTHRRHVTPNMIRVTLSGIDLPPATAGAHCKVMLPEPGESRGAFATRLGGEGPAPVRRTYTVRHARPETGEIDIDFVDHGDTGPASAFARRAAPGDPMGFAGPGAPKLVDFDAAFYLIAADMSALPVAAAALEALPRDACGLAFLEVTTEGDRQEIDAPDGVEIRWLIHPDPHVPSPAQENAIRAMVPPARPIRTMIAGETGTVRALRLLTRGEMGVDRRMSYASGYWRIGMAEDAHQQVKRAESEADEAKLAGAV
ncbi:siderophore-interacting protein [Jannaschia sp. 2305UL9-9]|uniref:siderophore-interacting protein n=1 Tax=Jannaschia sp. 2305UL9-9 TaxID=3121638 RepID=UPI00352981D7